MKINYKKIKVILIGNGNFPFENKLTSIPNIEFNIKKLTSCFLDDSIFGIPQKNLFIFHDLELSTLTIKLIDAITEDNNYYSTLILYYSGHGLISPNNFNLYLSAKDFSRKYFEYTSLSIATLKEIIYKSKAKQKIIILDCCYSGKMIGSMSNISSKIATTLDQFEGTYIMTSSDEISPSLYNHNNLDSPTFFTGQLINILQNGIHNIDKQHYSFKDIFEVITRNTIQLEKPLPQQLIKNNTGSLKIIKNRKYTTSEYKTSNSVNKKSINIIEVSVYWLMYISVSTILLLMGFSNKIEDGNLIWHGNYFDAASKLILCSTLSCLIFNCITIYKKKRFDMKYLLIGNSLNCIAAYFYILNDIYRYGFYENIQYLQYLFSTKKILLFLGFSVINILIYLNYKKTVKSKWFLSFYISISCIVLFYIYNINYIERKYQGALFNGRGFSEGLLGVSENGKCGYIDIFGDQVIPFTYDNVHRFQDGLARVHKYGLMGFIDKKGNTIVPVKYNLVADFKDGLAAVNLDGKWGFVDKQGHEVIPPIYQGSDWSIGSFKEGLLNVMKDNKWGYINNVGKVIIPFIYDSAEPFQEGLAPVKRKEKWGYINQKNEITIDFQYSKASPFKNGIAKVMYKNIESSIYMEKIPFFNEILYTVQIPIRNQSFELNSSSIHFPPVNWIECSIDTSTITSIHSNSSSIFDFKGKAWHGDKFISIITQSDGRYSTISQELSKFLKSEKHYIISMYVAQPNNYKISQNNYASNPILIKIFGGKNHCDSKKVLLAKSDIIKNKHWKVKHFLLNPKEDFDHLIIEAACGKKINDKPYNGAILIDSISNIKGIVYPKDKI